MSQQIRYFRYLVLLLILLAVILHNRYIQKKVHSWDTPLSIKIFPINGDGSSITTKYIQSLNQIHIEDIALFFNTQAKNYQVSSQKAIHITLGSTIPTLPPKLPAKRTILNNIYWSVIFRAWVNWQLFKYHGFDTDISIFVIYFDPENSPQLKDSIGLQKGLIGLVNAYADPKYQGSNNVIITHEVLHTLGATDKYTIADNYPIYPIGFAEPHKLPLFPQEKAEIMAGRIPKSPHKAEIPESLDTTLIGEITAREIYWLTE